jgi:hypothetical protein
MNAHTVFEVFLALTPDEKYKFIALINEQKSKTSPEIRKRKSKPAKFTKEDAINYLLATVFKPKNRPD